MGSEQIEPEASSAKRGPAICGRCMCGDIRYEFTGPMFDVVHCHCETCRRHSSTPFVTFYNVHKTEFRYTRGAPVRYESSPGIERTHCGRCGSPISWESAQEFSVFACTLDDLTLVKPQAHIFVGESLPWVNFGDDLPCYEKGPRGEPIGYGPSNLPQVSVESVLANSQETNSARDKFSGANAATMTST